MTRPPRRSRLGLALLLSLALHALLGLWWGRRAPAPPARSASAPLLLDILERQVPLERQAPRARPEVRPPVAGPSRTSPPRPSPAPRAQRAPAPPPDAPAAPKVSDAPNVMRLFPGPEGLPVPPENPGTLAGGGRTWRPGEGPSPEEHLAEERERVRGRVQGLVEDKLAVARVEGGIVDPYFTRMRKALEQRMKDAPLFNYQGVLRNAPVLDVELELEQARTGQVLGVKLLRGSGNAAFDQYVLEQVPGALAALEPAAESFAARTRAPTVRSAWNVRGWVSFARTVKLSQMHQLDDAAAYVTGLLGGQFDETRGEVIVTDLRHPHFDVRARLLRTY